MKKNNLFPKFTNLNTCLIVFFFVNIFSAKAQEDESKHLFARISGVSKRTVETQRYRLSKKINLPQGEDLNTYIITL
jgi:hypothetical protein